MLTNSLIIVLLNDTATLRACCWVLSCVSTSCLVANKLQTASAGSVCNWSAYLSRETCLLVAETSSYVTSAPAASKRTSSTSSVQACPRTQTLSLSHSHSLTLTLTCSLTLTLTLALTRTLTLTLTLTVTLSLSLSLSYSHSHTDMRTVDMNFVLLSVK